MFDLWTRGERLTESEFVEITERIYSNIQAELDSMDADLDCEEQQGVLAIECPDRSEVILSRQVATMEIWVAARSGGYHLRFDDQDWVCSKTGEKLAELLGRVCEEQSGQIIRFSL